MNTHCHTADAVVVSHFRRWWPQRPETLIFATLLMVFSGPMLFGSATQTMIFHPAAVLGGEWWRVFTHPFVHVTWYHLLLDASAFFLLYNGLIETKAARRLIYVVAGAAGSLLLSWVTATAISIHGLCGLSGIAHGLMAISAVEMMSDRSPRCAEWRIGAFTFALVVGKAAYEAVTGDILFGFLYFGLVGEPVAISHAGGIVGGLLGMLFLSKLGSEKHACNPTRSQEGCVHRTL